MGACRFSGALAARSPRPCPEIMRPSPLAVCIAVGFLFPAGALIARQAGAQNTPLATGSAPLTGNPDTGKTLAYACLGCHGVNGYRNAYPRFRIPKVGGQSSQYLTQALLEYREGRRKHPTMQAQARRFSDQDIADIAAFLSTLK